MLDKQENKQNKKRKFRWTLFSLGPLVNKVKEFQVETIVDTLCSNMLSDKEQLRDISSIGLKTVISELPPASTALAASICKKITGRLTSAIAKVAISHFCVWGYPGYLAKTTV